jgi:spermidine/putrescine transport system permease protein
MVLRRITLPLIAPSVLGGMVIAFAISFDEVLITNFTSGTRQTLPLFVLSRLRRTIDPSVNAVATILLVVPWIAVTLLFVAQRRRAARHAGEIRMSELARAA